MAELKLRDRTPNFYLPSTTNENYLFESYLQKHEGCWHLIVFFQGAWSSVCLEHLRELEQLQKEWKRMDIQITAITTDNLDNLKRMSQKEKYSFPILSDEFFSVVDAFGVYKHSPDSGYGQSFPHSEPAHFLVDENGLIVYQQKQTSPYGRSSAKAIQKSVQHLTTKTNSIM